MSDSAIWFCGVQASWEFFSAPLIPTRCYFSATLTKATLNGAGVQVWDSEAGCDCIPQPPPPSSPPSTIYFCGKAEVQPLFEAPIFPTRCYYSSQLTRIQVMSHGVNACSDADDCRRCARTRRRRAVPAAAVARPAAEPGRAARAAGAAAAAEPAAAAAVAGAAAAVGVAGAAARAVAGAVADAGALTLPEESDEAEEDSEDVWDEGAEGDGSAAAVDVPTNASTASALRRGGATPALSLSPLPAPPLRAEPKAVPDDGPTDRIFSASAGPPLLLAAAVVAVVVAARARTRRRDDDGGHDDAPSAAAML